MTRRTAMAYVGIDWGTSRFRAYAFDQNRQLIDHISTEHGIKFVENLEFERTLFELIGHWLTQSTTVVLSGMITSKQGWIETPYLTVPAPLNVLLAQAVQQHIRDTTFLFLPGLNQTSPNPDVIRGEELQLLGAAAKSDTTITVLPGTHSKWAQLNNGVVTQFNTIITGELFDTLLNHTVVGQLGVGRKMDTTAFIEAVKSGYHSKTIISDLFTARSGVLLGTIAPELVYPYLSGLLIGNEISAGLRLCDHAENATVQLIGDDALCDTYKTAMQTLNINAVSVNKSAAIDGFQHIFQQVK